jgi:hypothetical protein
MTDVKPWPQTGDNTKLSAESQSIYYRARASAWEARARVAVAALERSQFLGTLCASDFRNEMIGDNVAAVYAHAGLALATIGPLPKEGA